MLWPAWRSTAIGRSSLGGLLLERFGMALGVASGVLIQPAAIGLILVMLGAIQKKAFVWKTGFWGDECSRLLSGPLRGPTDGSGESLSRLLSLEGHRFATGALLEATSLV